MKICILVATAGNLAALRGIAEVALGRGHGVSVFATDEGVNLLRDPLFVALVSHPGIDARYCSQSTDRRGGPPQGLPGAIRAGSQMDHALMQAAADRTVVL